MNQSPITKVTCFLNRLEVELQKEAVSSYGFFDWKSHQVCCIPCSKYTSTKGGLRGLYGYLVVSCADSWLEDVLLHQRTPEYFQLDYGAGVSETHLRTPIGGSSRWLKAAISGVPAFEICFCPTCSWTFTLVLNRPGRVEVATKFNIDARLVVVKNNRIEPHGFWSLI